MINFLSLNYLHILTASPPHRVTASISPFLDSLHILTASILILLLGYIGVPLWVWSLYFLILLAIFNPNIWVLVAFSTILLILNIPILRQKIITSPLMYGIKTLKILPKISDTERAAIEAGTVWVDGEFFSGKPNFQRINSEPYPQVTPELQSFLDNQVETVCQMVSDWEIYQRQDLPPEVWEYLKKERFLGMMIPQEYGGLGFSNFAYSAVMTKLASRSFTHVATVGVTNSLGPAKLLLRYGTPTQKNDYLPRLARGEEIPCFALTEATAGSDAASIQSEGVVFKGGDGKLYIRLHWKKRYITLGAIATLLGLAFRLQDPKNYLGKGKNIGITCALIPTNTPGVIMGRRHDPMGVPFYNSPTEGHDVVVSIDQIIGGVEQAGNGWKMLMQSLAAGRGISFPATCTGVAKLVTRVTSAHSVVRQQFGLSIGKFEGIEEPLARIGGLTYLMDAARIYTAAAVDKGEQPAVISAIAKYNLTELSRQIINDGMDIMGGAGICRGKRNLLANIYTATPISITVEGANILTRTMMIFGQGAIRCHPYVYAEIAALEEDKGKVDKDLQKSSLSPFPHLFSVSPATIAFDTAFWHHLGWMIRNTFRAIFLSISRGYLAVSPVTGATAKYYRKLAWASATFACLTDLAMFMFGGSLKRREKITGRFADILSWMYLGSATLRRFEAEGRKAEDLLFVDWAMQYAFAQIQQGFTGIFSNLSIQPERQQNPNKSSLSLSPRHLISASISLIIRSLGNILAWWWRMNPIGTMPSDTLGSQIAHIIQIPGQQRDRITAGIYIPVAVDESLGRLERAFNLLHQVEPILKKIKNASHEGKLPIQKPELLISAALHAGIIGEPEVELFCEAQFARNDAIQVDSFTLEEYMGNKGSIVAQNSQTKELTQIS
ncbi:acyl-CoA dehydrogenase [Calothrix sp. UHCC 0171]|uniref:acyl-CoA dehydrogenase n=1 Tax=Calothrix sp. UHCC 0171 TaxID=3110245 RepID=UPI002B2006F1|nr:acyl-CoA dehydrogenase [Calothrix sp. UHCC 0171]MEA5572573.1 acyl-CoA dehydrogenase [Calothrix sp. UHCC 0171]